MDIVENKTDVIVYDISTCFLKELKQMADADLLTTYIALSNRMS